MGMYVKSSCPKCGNVIEPYTRNYIAIGVPFVQCPKCDTLVIFKNIQEWGCMKFQQKAYYLFVTLYTGLFWGFGLAMCGFFYLLFSGKIPGEINSLNDFGDNLWILIAGLLLGFVLHVVFS